MRDLERTLKAAGDPTRTRILKLLEAGVLCVCQIQAVLRFAPSTVSKHLAILKVAGLVEDRRDGRWIEYRLAPDARNPYARPLLEMLHGPLDRDATIVADRRRLRAISAIPLGTLCAMPAARVAGPMSGSKRQAPPGARSGAAGRSPGWARRHHAPRTSGGARGTAKPARPRGRAS